MNKISNRLELIEITLAIILMLQSITFTVDNEMGWGLCKVTLLNV
jgi:hypothetical protein